MFRSRFRIKINETGIILHKAFQLILLNNKTKLKAHLQDHPEDIKQEHDGVTTLCYAINHNAHNSFDVLLEFNADTRAKEHKFITNNALMVATRKRNIYCTDILLSKGLRFLSNDHILHNYIFNEDDVKLFAVIAEYYPSIKTNTYRDGQY